MVREVFKGPSVDAHAAGLIDDVSSGVGKLFKPIDGVLEYLGGFLPQERKPHRKDLPTPFQVFVNTKDSFIVYHSKIYNHSLIWSLESKRGFERIFNFFLYPITFCQTGEAIRKGISEQLLGNIVKYISFIALQIFHALPYLLMIAAIEGVDLLYTASPVFLITSLVTTLLVTQLFLLYQLNQGVDYLNQLGNHYRDQFNGVAFVFGTLKAASIWAIDAAKVGGGVCVDMAKRTSNYVWSIGQRASPKHLVGHPRVADLN